MLKVSEVTPTATIQKDLSTQDWNPGQFEYSWSIAKFDEANEVRRALFVRALIAPKKTSASEWKFVMNVILFKPLQILAFQMSAISAT